MKKINFFALLMLTGLASAIAQRGNELPKELSNLEKQFEYSHFGEQDMHPEKRFEQWNEQQFLYNQKDADFSQKIKPWDRAQNFMLPENLSHLNNNETRNQYDSLHTYNFLSETDSILSERVLYEFDTHGRLIILAKYRWDNENETWIGLSKFEYAYDAQGNRVLFTQYQWDTENETWINSLRNEFEYDSYGNMTLETSYQWVNEFEEWIIYWKYEYEYDEQFKITLKKTYKWDDIDDVWKNHAKTEYGYDSQGNNNLVIIHNWGWEDEWTNHHKSEYEYNEQGKLISQINSWWENQMWLNHVKIIYKYNAQGRQILSVFSQWDTENDQWLNISKSEYDYNAEGKQILFLRYNWDNENELWTNHMKGEQEFNEHGNSILYTLYQWENELWINLLKFEYEHDEQNKTTIEAKYLWDAEDNIWVVDSKTFYFYPGDTTHVTEPGNDFNPGNVSEISVYPNPSHDKISVRSSEEILKIMFYNLNGQLIKTLDVKSLETEISVSDMNTGVYLMQIYTSRSVSTERIKIVH